MRARVEQLAAESDGHRFPFQDVDVRIEIDADRATRELGLREAPAFGNRGVGRKSWEGGTHVDDVRADARRRLLRVTIATALQSTSRKAATERLHVNMNAAFYAGASAVSCGASCKIAVLVP